MICSSKQIFTGSFFLVSSTFPLAVDAVTQLRCVIFLDKFSPSIDKIAFWLRLPPAPSFWEARDQPEPGSFFRRGVGI